MSETYKLNEEMIYRKIGEQRMLVPIGQHIDDVRSIYTLNETAAFVLDGLQAEQTPDQVAEKMAEEYELTSDLDPLKVVTDVIKDFRQHNIIL